MMRTSEHYPDPTFAAAYRNICKKERGYKNMPWVYIASPYRGDTERNIENARIYSAYAVQRGKLPLCPHIYFTQFLDDNDPAQRRIGLNLGLQMLKRCRELWVFGDIVTEGMQNEIAAAMRWNIPIRYVELGGGTRE